MKKEMVMKVCRGKLSEMPSRTTDRKLLVTTDTFEIFVGAGPDLPVRPMTDLQEIAKMLATGFVL